MASAMRNDKPSAHLAFEHLLYQPALNATPSLMEQLVLSWYALTGPQMLKGDIGSLQDERDMMVEDLVVRGPFDTTEEIWPFVYQLWRKDSLVTWVEQRGGYQVKYVGLRSQMPPGAQISGSPVYEYRRQAGASTSIGTGGLALVQAGVVLGAGYLLYKWGQS